jgi:two-component system, NarL family, nitrate/nitrite response regulator NarL
LSIGQASTPSGLRVLIADDHDAFRAGVRKALEARGFLVVADVPDADSAVAAAIREQPDIALIDLAMPGDGLTAIAQIARRVRGTLVIALTVSEASDDVRNAIANGASGYVLKGGSGDELATLLQDAYRGSPAYSQALVPQLIEALQHGSHRRLTLPGGPVSLTPREWDVAQLMREGLPSKAIAVQLGVSPITARKHVASIVHKLGAHDRATAVQMLALFSG